MSDTLGVYDDPRYEEAARTEYLSALIDQERLEHALEVAALKARVEELEKQLTVTDDRDRTHSAECWKWHRHHACAIGRVEVLEGMLAQRNEILDKLLPRYNADDQEKPKADSAEIRAIMRELQDRESWMSDESRKSWK